ncbi:MAG: hypothetical protein KAT05_16770 [Spirochaetes bacterium]|nr:hypothetical protein [Spirochaetota bacterium]
MIKIRPYKHTDRYQFEKMIKAFYQENKFDPPDNQKILDTIGFFTAFPQCGKIYLILFNNNPIGYSIILNQWKLQYGKVSYRIDELYISDNYRKHKPEINLVEYLIKQEGIHSIEIKLDKLKSSSRKIFRFFKFNRDFSPFFRKILDGE